MLVLALLANNSDIHLHYSCEILWCFKWQNIKKLAFLCSNISKLLWSGTILVSIHYILLLVSNSKNPKCSKIKSYMSQGTTRSETVKIFWATVDAVLIAQESLWRHGVVHDPAKKKVKVTCQMWGSCVCVYVCLYILFYFFYFYYSPYRNWFLKRISPGAGHCRSDWQLQPIKRTLTNLLKSWTKQI